ncbi:hypothetical protein C8Q76DRAFT_219899 [Earliella scabrosa]|nr:hypothetical protein C8Q76DRAFT_219899 [Earliella scabrosa]
MSFQVMNRRAQLRTLAALLHSSSCSGRFGTEADGSLRRSDHRTTAMYYSHVLRVAFRHSAIVLVRFRSRCCCSDCPLPHQFSWDEVQCSAHGVHVFWAQ